MFLVTNLSKRVSNSDVKLMVRAVAHQLRYDAAPAWGRAPVPVVYSSHANEDGQPGAVVIAILDDADQADDLGWHSENQGEMIYGRVFAGPALDNGGDALHKDLSVASVLSHEVLEAFIDPSCNGWAQYSGLGDCIALEIGDPVEADSYGVPVNGHGIITVSNFVLPRWFDPDARGGTFDKMGRVKAPFQMSKGGYVVKLSKGNVTQQFGEDYPEWRRETKRSDLARTARRVVGLAS